MRPTRHPATFSARPTMVAGPRPLVLVVEDDEALQRAFVILLERSGHEVISTASGRQAMQLLHKKPAVVLCDYMLPDADGLQVLAVARETAPQAEFILATAFGSQDVAIRALQLGASDFLTKPLPTMDLLVDRVQRAAERHRLKTELVESRAQLQKANHELSALLEQTERRYVGLTQLLSGILDLNDPELAAHSRRVGSLASDVATELHLEPRVVREVEVAALLHDVGFLALTPGGGRDDRPLTDEELAQHPVLGAALIEALDPDAAAIVRHHHERWDGGGFPDGLAGDAIPYGARIVAACEAFDEASTWPLRDDGDPVAQALDMLQGERGAGFDRKVVDALRRVWKRRTEKKRRVAECPIGDLHPGIVLARSVHSPTGLLLLRENQELTDADVARIRSFHRAQPVRERVYVYRDGEA